MQHKAKILIVFKKKPLVNTHTAAPTVDFLRELSIYKSFRRTMAFSQPWFINMRFLLVWLCEVKDKVFACNYQRLKSQRSFTPLMFRCCEEYSETCQSDQQRVGKWGRAFRTSLVTFSYTLTSNIFLFFCRVIW